MIAALLKRQRSITKRTAHAKSNSQLPKIARIEMNNCLGKKKKRKFNMHMIMSRLQRMQMLVRTKAKQALKRQAQRYPKIRMKII
jgi:hypothetical protein